MIEAPQTATNTAVLSATRPHFPLLDGLRGVAAIGVVTFHFMEMVIYNYNVLWIAHGFLAVDFFFCLSGFVMGYAYDNRIQTMGLKRFFQARLIRLHPMVVFGTLLGLIAFYANPFGVTPGYSATKMALIVAASLLMIPYGSMPERGQNLFCLNAPAWSLFWEYVANIVFAVILWRLRRGALIVLTLAAAVLLCCTAAHAGNLPGGWSIRNFWDGGARVAFSFLAGLLVYRTGWKLRTPLGFGALSLLLLLSFVIPYATGAWIREAAVIILFYPLLVVLGAGASVSPRVQKLCRFSGDLSYPLYMTHYCVLWIWGDFAAKYKPTGAALAGYVTCGVVTMIAVGCLVMVAYDKPVRKYLQANL